MRVLMLGDSPYTRTGFGIVNRVVYDTLLSEGHELVIIGGQDDGEPKEVPPGVTYVPSDQKTADMLGWSKLPVVVKEYKPDAVHIIADAAMTSTWLIHQEVRDLPTLAYVPIEGEPMNMIWVNTFKEHPRLEVTTCSYYGQRVLESEGIPSKMAYHGVSSDFRPLSPERRQELRELLGWDDKFVVMCVAQNVRRKQWPRLFEAISILKRKHPEVILYAHTVPFNNYWLDGHDLTQIAGRLGVADRVVFPPSHIKHNASIDVRGSDMPGLADLYGVADCFVLPSQVEGFGLPLAEAMASGLPVITTNYAAQAEVVGNAGNLLPVKDWEWNKSCSRYANVDPSEIASAISRLAKSKEYRASLAAKGIERAKRFDWSDYQSIVREFYGRVPHQEDTSPDNPLDEVERQEAEAALA